MLCYKLYHLHHIQQLDWFRYFRFYDLDHSNVYQLKKIKLENRSTEYNQVCYPCLFANQYLFHFQEIQFEQHLSYWLSAIHLLLCLVNRYSEMIQFHLLRNHHQHYGNIFHRQYLQHHSYVQHFHRPRLQRTSIDVHYPRKDLVNLLDYLDQKPAWQSR